MITHIQRTVRIRQEKWCSRSKNSTRYIYAKQYGTWAIKVQYYQKGNRLVRKYSQDYKINQEPDRPRLYI